MMLEKKVEKNLEVKMLEEEKKLGVKEKLQKSRLSHHSG